MRRWSISIRSVIESTRRAFTNVSRGHGNRVPVRRQLDRGPLGKFCRFPDDGQRDFFENVAIARTKWNKCVVQKGPMEIGGGSYEPQKHM